MSSEWPSATFAELIDRGALEIGDGYRAKNDELGGEGLVFLRAGHVKDTHIDFDGADHFFGTDEVRFGRKISQPGDVVITTKGNSTGRVAYVTKAMPRFVYSPHLSYWRSTSETAVDQGFLRAWSQSAEFLAQLDAMSRSTDMAPYLSLTDQRHLRITLLPFPAQRMVAAINDALHDRVNLLRETNATLEAIAQALFKSWFVDFDPVRAKSQGLAPAGMDEATAALFPDGFEESVLGPVPAGWPCIDLGDLTHRHGGAIQTGPFGSQLHAKDYVDTGIPVVMPKDIVGRRVSTDSIARVGVTDAERLARHKLQAGDIVFSRRGDVERHALITEREVGWLCGTGCLLVRPGPRWESPGFLSMLLDAPRARTWLVQHAVGATMPNLNTGILSSVPLVLPPPALLAAFDAVVATTEEQRSRNATMSETLAEVRDTLLPRLISGQLRLPHVEEAISEATHAD